MDLDSLFNDPNGNAYVKKEVRVGSPLEYVGEKIRKSIESYHQLLNSIDEYIPDNYLPLNHSLSDVNYSIKKDCLESPAYYGFHNSLVAFAALYNMLGAIQNYSPIESLARLSEEELEEMLNFIENEGSIGGLA